MIMLLQYLNASRYKVADAHRRWFRQQYQRRDEKNNEKHLLFSNMEGRCFLKIMSVASAGWLGHDSCRAESF